MFLKTTAIILTILGAASVARANDFGIDGIGGSPKPLKGEHSSVRMESETIRIDLYQDHYDTSAEFVFRNNGRAKKVAMAFPESGAGDTGNGYETDHKSAFLDFRTSVDGRALKAKRVLTSQPEGGPGYDALWVKTVPFGARQTRRVRVNYRSRYGSGFPLYRRVASYSFTGKNWRGDVARSTLRAVWHIPGTFVFDADSDKKPAQMRRLRNGIEWTWRHWPAQAEWDLSFARTLPGWRLTDQDYFWQDRAAQMREITVAGRAAPLRPTYDWLPSAWMQNGVLWMPLQNVAEIWKDRAKTQLQYDSSRQMATLHIDQSEIYFGTTSKQMGYLQHRGRNQGTEAIQLPFQPRLIAGQMAVPVAPLLHRMNVKVTSPTARSLKIVP